MKAQWTVLWALWAARIVEQHSEPVRVQGGWLRGTLAPDGTHRRYLGIPYARVTNRFQAAEQVPPWDGVFDANNEHIRCFQRFTSTHLAGQEDCLTLNVYTPINPSSQLRPVMLFIHGGGFRDGSGSPFLYGPEYFIKHDVILVTFNYRLEILGFLCLGIKEAPGNVGLKDQVDALKWVRNNIAAFGGNPEDVTIFGESAGSASVLYHILSPMSKGLFNKAIMQSGSAMTPWSLQFEPIKTASLLAKEMGYDTTDPHKLYEIFREQPLDKLLSTRVPRGKGDVVISENIFVPCIEAKIPEVNQFLAEAPYNLLRTGNYTKIPVIIGFNDAEGYMFAGKETATTVAELSFNGSLPRDLTISSEHERMLTAETLQQLYMDGEEISKENIWKFSKYVGDSNIVFPVVATTDLLSKTMDYPIFVYKFSYDGTLNFAKFVYGFAKYPGATHADELFYMFNIPVNVPKKTADSVMIDRMTTIWTNFAKYRDPTPKTTALLPTRWRPLQKENPILLVIDKQFSTEPLWNDPHLLYWNETYTKYRRKG